MEISVGFRVMESAMVNDQYARMVRTEMTGNIPAAVDDSDRGEVNNLLEKIGDDTKDNTKLDAPDISMRKEEETLSILHLMAKTFVMEPAMAAYKQRATPIKNILSCSLEGADSLSSVK